METRAMNVPRVTLISLVNQGSIVIGLAGPVEVPDVNGKLSETDCTDLIPQGMRSRSWFPSNYHRVTHSFFP